MPKINQLPRASTLAATDLLAKENTSGTSTEGVSASQIADFVKTTLPSIDSTLTQEAHPADAKAVGDALADKQDKLTFDANPTAGSQNPVTSDGIKSALDQKQGNLTFDDAPTAGSNNPVKSKGIKSVLDTKQNNLTFDSTPTANSSNPVTSAGIKTALDTKQNTLTFDNVPTNGSNNPVKSDGVFDADEAIRGSVTELKTQLISYRYMDEIKGNAPQPATVGMQYFSSVSGKIRIVTAVDNSGNVTAYDEVTPSTNWIYIYKGEIYEYNGSIICKKTLVNNHGILIDLANIRPHVWREYSASYPVTVSEQDEYTNIKFGNGSSIAQGIAMLQIPVSVQKGDKILIYFDVRHNTYLPQTSYVGIHANGVNSYYPITNILCARQIVGAYEHQTFIIDAKETSDIVYYMLIRASYSNVSQASASSIDVKNINIVNLTDTFGNDVPSENEMDWFIQKQKDSYITQYAVYEQPNPVGVRLYNMIDNGDFALGDNGLFGWTTGQSITSLVSNGDGTATVSASANDGTGSIFFHLKRPMINDHVYYVSGYVHNIMNFFSDSTASTIYGKIDGYFSRVYKNTRDNYFTPYFRVFDTSKNAIFGNLILIDLTEMFGAGKEPNSAIDVDYALSQVLETRFFNGFVNAVFSDTNFNRIKFETIGIDTEDITEDPQITPILWGAKISNSCSIDSGYADSHPISTVWLYYDKNNPNQIYSSVGRADNLKPLFEWDDTLESSACKPINYCPVICDNGDIVCVFRNETVVDSERRSPIVYKHGVYTNPVKVDFGSSLKPSGWFGNSGCKFISADQSIVFGEYTRPYTEPANVWKVTAPYDEAASWTRVIETSGTGAGTREVEHFHAIDVDTFTGKIYAISGDSESESKIWESSDNGSTWSVVLENDNNACRTLNLCFTKEYLYYGSDNTSCFYGVKRSADMSIDFSNVEVIANMNDHLDDVIHGRTYFTVLIDEPYGVLLLQVDDAATGKPVPVFFYDIKRNYMQRIALLTPSNSEAVMTGFRCDAVSYYQSMEEKRIVCGFGQYPCYIGFPGNRYSDNGVKRSNLGNVAITIY